MNYLIAIDTGRRIYTHDLKPGDTASIGDSRDDKPQVMGYGLGASYLVLSCNAGGVQVISRRPMKFGTEETSNRVLSAGESISITDNITLAVFEDKSGLNSELPLEGFDELHIGRVYNDKDKQRFNDICLKDAGVSRFHAVLRKIDGHWVIADLNSTNGTFVNGGLAPANTELPAENVNIFICGYIFYIENNRLKFTKLPGKIEFAPDVADSLVPLPAREKAYPFFIRSPRITSRPEKAEFEVSSPPNVGTKPNISWFTVMMPPVMMIAVMGFVAVMTKNYNMLIYSVPMSVMSLIVSFVNNKNNVKKWLKNNGLAAEKYTAYLAETDRKITEAEGAYISSLSMASPGVYECIAIAKNVSRRLWERAPEDNDFLSVRVGTCSRESNVKLKLPSAQMTIEDNPLLLQAQAVRSKHTTLTGIPVCHSLMNCPITGLVGERSNIKRMAWRIIMDIATHNSYEDVKIICIYPEKERAEWEWMRWLPHIWDEKHEQRCLACTEEQASSILRSAKDILTPRMRKVAPGLSRDAAPQKPFYVLILADKSLVDASNEQFLPNSPSLGFAVVYVYGDMGTLPREYNSVISCDDPARIQNRGSTDITFTPDRISSNNTVCVNMLDEFARALAPIRLASSGSGSRMPACISFLQGVGAETIQDLKIMDRWKSANPVKSLAAPMGIMENGQTFYFNIIDSSIKGSGGMGPHGMTLGTTGSGKTETLTTLLLSIALTYSPEDVNFALIEFKGASLSNVLHPLPHISGIITNLDDPSSTIRGLRSVKGEMMRRQRIFAKIKDLTTQDLPTYMKYRKTHPDAEPIPYLIVVIDEFAEFIKQFPDFQNEVTSIALTGRSMGVYMILTMQSAQGVVKDQVKSNLRFRICMRTASAADSKEVLGTEDAFKLSAPGRTIIKVGGDEDSGSGPKPIYEHIQTFYAKASYNPGAGKTSAPEEISLVSLRGTKTKPKIYGQTVIAEKEETSQGTLVVHSIARTAKENNLRHAVPVWTEPLPTMLALDGLIAGHEAYDRQAKTWTSRNRGLAVTVGLVDDPQGQTKYPFVLDFMKNGHQLLYGESSSGKTTFLQTMVLSTALSYTPEQVNFVILDYNSNVLNLFDALPHTLITPAKDNDKLKKARDFLRSELDRRSSDFGAAGVTSLEAYRAAIGKPVPAIIVVVDNLAGLNNQSSEMMDTLKKIASDGGSLGIYLMVTALNNSGGFMYNIAQYVKSKHTLQMTEKTDYRTLANAEIGTYPGKFRGRGIVQGGLEFHTALCVDVAPEEVSIDGDDEEDRRNRLEAERSKKLKALCADMSESWTGKRASLEAAESESSAPIQAGELKSSGDGVQIGMKKGTREPVEFAFSAMNGCVISGTYGGGKSSILAMIASALDKDENTSVYVYEENSVLEKFCPKARAMHKPEDADKVIAELAEEFDKRTYDTKGRIALCIDDFYNFYQEITQASADILNVIAERGADKGIYIYVSCSAKGLSVLGNTPLFMKLLAHGNAVITGGNLGEYQAFKNMHHEGSISFGQNEGCVIHDNKVIELRFGQPEGV